MDRDVESVCSLFVIADDAFGQSDLDGDSDRCLSGPERPIVIVVKSGLAKPPQSGLAKPPTVRLAKPPTVRCDFQPSGEAAYGRGW